MNQTDKNHLDVDRVRTHAIQVGLLVSAEISLAYGLLQKFIYFHVLTNTFSKLNMNKQSQPDTKLDLREDFLAGMRYVANSVTVVTTNGVAGISGVTVSAFSSVSADPPTVLVCLNSASSTLEALQANKDFCVNVLPEGAKHIAERFAGFHDTAISDRFEGIDLTDSKGPSPVISGATAFICKLGETLSSGSHVICIGHIVETHAGNFTPLIYMDRKFKRISDIEG